MTDITALRATTWFTLLTAAGLAAAAPPAAAPPAAAPSAAAPAMHAYRALALNADGTRLAAIESDDAPGNLKKIPPVLVLRDTVSGRVVASYAAFGACADCQLDAPAWSPDQQALAFIGADRKAGSATLFVLRDGKITALTTVKGVANSARWSRDGRQIAMLATVGAKKLTGAVEAGAAQVGEIGTAEDEQRIGVVPAQGGAFRLVSPPDTFVYEYDWTPDGKGFVVTSAKGNGDNNWWVATLGHVDAASGKLRILAAPKMQMNRPRVAPDGATVAFIGGLMSDFGSVGGDVYTVPLGAHAAHAPGAAPVDVTPGYQGTFTGIAWRGQAIYASVLAGSDSAVVAVDPQARTARTLWSGAVTASASGEGHVVFSADARFAASVHEDFVTAPRIVAGALPALQAITHDNDGFGAQVSARSVGWTNDGYAVQGWLVGPRMLDPAKKYPMIVQVHGGPSAAATPRFVAGGASVSTLRDLTSNGYFVFMPNPRGSFGQGAAFGAANRRDFGGGDWRDILAGVDRVLQVAPVDGARLGLFGHSYGGFMTMWGVTHSDRFKAAVAGAGIANWISYYGQNGIDQWMVPFFGATAYDDPAVYRAASPIESIKAARTPTFIYVGERDVECPPAQSVEFWHGLRAMGTPVSLVIYDGEGHALRQPEHQNDLRKRMVGWFDKYLK